MFCSKVYLIHGETFISAGREELTEMLDGVISPYHLFLAIPLSLDEVLLAERRNYLQLEV